MRVCVCVCVCVDDKSVIGQLRAELVWGNRLSASSNETFNDWLHWLSPSMTG